MVCIFIWLLRSSIDYLFASFKRLKNRLYVSWTNSTGMDCILVGPETPCFCQHRYFFSKIIYSFILTKKFEIKI